MGDKVTAMTQVELAKHWGVSGPRVSQLVKEGCPLDSLASADKWRSDRGNKRVGKVEEEPDRPVGEVPPMRQPVKTGDGLDDALACSIMVCDGAFADYEYARVNGLGSRMLRLTEFNKALDSRLKTEKAYRMEQLRRGTLVDKIEITEMCRRCLDSVLRRLKKLPQEKGPQCNPQDSLRAVRILEAEVASIIQLGQDVINGLSE